MEKQFTSRELSCVFGIWPRVVISRARSLCLHFQSKPRVSTVFSYHHALALMIHHTLTQEGFTSAAAATIVRPLARQIPACLADPEFEPFLIFFADMNYFVTDERALAYRTIELAADGNGRAVAINIRSSLRRAAALLEEATDTQEIAA